MEQAIGAYRHVTATNEYKERTVDHGIKHIRR